MVPSGQDAQDLDGDGMSPEQQQLLNTLEAKLDSLEQHGMTLEDALKRMQEQERAEAGPPDLVKDIWPTQRVLNEAIEAARSSKVDETVAALDRLTPLVVAVKGDLPASRIMIHCERALAHLSQNALDEAGAEMAFAHRVADGTKFATLVPPNVISLIQTSARSQIQAGRTREAADVVRTILNAAADHQSLDRMSRIEDAIAGARVAVDRGAWPVVEAELFEAHRELTDLSETIRPERWDLSGAEMDEAAAVTDDEGAAEGDEPAEEGEDADEDTPGEAEEPESGVDAGQDADAEADDTRPRPRRIRR